MTGLPTRCPAWCDGGAAGHQQALDEGCSVEIARVHLSGDLGGQVNDISNFVTKRVVRRGTGGWRVQLQQDEPEDGCYDMAVIELELHERRSADLSSTGYDYTRLNLTTGEARALAAQLLHLADREDVHR